MTWVDSLPSVLGPIIPPDLKPLQLLAIPHTSLLIILTDSTVFIYDINSLIFLAKHSRNEDPLEKHGSNKLVKIRHLGINSAQLQKLTTVNLFVETESNYLIIYQVSIDYSKSVYELSSRDTNEVIQSGLPLSLNYSKFSISSLMKSATRSILLGSSAATINLENIEHFNNRPIEDELGVSEIHPVKISVFKIVKIGLGISNFWLVPNLHFLVVFNDENEREADSHGAYFQTVDLKSFKSNMFELSDFEWYQGGSAIKYLSFNKFDNYFLFVNADDEVWFMQLDFQEEKTLVSAEKVSSLKLDNIRFQFNPQCDLILIKQDLVVNIYKLSPLEKKLVKLHSVALDGANSSVAWSPCGTFFVILDHDTNCWSLVSKFGNRLFNSSHVANELNDPRKESADFLKASKIIVAPNASRVVMINSIAAKLYSIDLLRQPVPQSELFYNQNYISSLDPNGSLYKVPILPKFKNIISIMEHINIDTPNHTSPSGRFTISRNDINQFSLAYGEHLTISTPCGTNRDKNHIIWFNFKNHFLTSMNIVGHFWFSDFLVVINRFNNDGSEIDEIIVMDTIMSKYGQGGVEYVFDSDRIVWRRSFNNRIIAHDLSNSSKASQMLTCVTSDLKILVIELSKNKPKAENNFRETTKHPKLHIRFHKTVHLSAIESKLAVSKVVQVSMIDDQHFLFLLGSGELYMLRNVSTPERSTEPSPIDVLRPAHMYELVQVHDTISFFKFKTLGFGQDAVKYVTMLNCNHVFIYDLKRLFDSGIGDVDLGVEQDVVSGPGSIAPDAIRLKADSFMPITIEEVINEKLDGLKSIDLIGLQTDLFSRQGHLFLQTRANRQLVLNDFIEKEVVQHQLTAVICKMFQQYENFDYCLELLLFKYLTFDQNEEFLRKVVAVIETLDDSEVIYVNCLRKIEVEYWDLFFKTLDTTPIIFMRRLIANDNVELCYNYLNVYLNYKREEDEVNAATHKLDANDKEIILKIIKVLSDANKWDWCFELCRFIKLLEPKGTLLQTILKTLK